MKRQHTTQVVCIAYTIFSLSIALGCADLKTKLKPTGDKINASIRSAVDPLDDVFSGDSKKKKTTQTKNTATPDANANTPPASAEMFFDAPKDWTIVKFVAESMRYQLKHDSESNASLVVSHHDLDAQADEAKRQEQLRQLHNQLIGRLPENYKKLEYREWVEDDHPHLLTRLKGQRGDDGPEMIVEGYSVSIGAEGFIVFAAFPSEKKTLSEEVNVVVKSLRPLPPPAEESPSAEDKDKTTDPAQAPTKGSDKTTPVDKPDPEEDTVQGKPPQDL